MPTDGSHELFIDRRKFSRQVEAYLTQLAELHEPGEFEAATWALAKGGAKSRSTRCWRPTGSVAKIALDPVLAADRLRMLVEDNGGTVIAAPIPPGIPRATKNQAEINGTRAAHRRDGAAVAKLLCWLERQEPGSLDEIAGVTRLEETRRQTGEETQMPLRDISFDTISGAGPNGAIIALPGVARHQPQAAGRRARSCSIPAAQYQDGTTDITRTVADRPADRRRCATASRGC